MKNLHPQNHIHFKPTCIVTDWVLTYMMKIVDWRLTLAFMLMSIDAVYSLALLQRKKNWIGRTMNYFFKVSMGPLPAISGSFARIGDVKIEFFRQKLHSLLSKSPSFFIFSLLMCILLLPNADIKSRVSADSAFGSQYFFKSFFGSSFEVAPGWIVSGGIFAQLKDFLSTLVQLVFVKRTIHSRFLFSSIVNISSWNCSIFRQWCHQRPSIRIREFCFRRVIDHSKPLSTSTTSASVWIIIR